MRFSEYLKTLFRSTVNLFLALTMAGCGGFLEGKKSEPEVLEFSNKKMQCLQDLPTQLKKYSVGEAKNADVIKAFDCMKVSLKYFTERTHGARENMYATEEMRRFFGKYFLKENNVSPEFSVELMKIKKALLGGSGSYLSKDEIYKLIDILEVVKVEAVAVNPYVKVLLTQNVQGSVDLETVSSATAQLNISLQKLLVQTQISQSNYSFEDAKKALAGFADFVNAGAGFVPYQRYSEWVPLIEAAKNILMGRKAELTGLPQWSEALETVVDLYELVLKYHYQLHSFKDLNRSKVRELGQFAQQIIRVLKQSPQMKNRGYIPLDDIDDLIIEAAHRWSQPPHDPENDSRKWLRSLSAESLKEAYRVFLLRILERNHSDDYLNLQGLGEKHLRSLYREFSVWRVQQSFIDALPVSRMDAGGLTQLELLDHYKSFNQTEKIAKILTSDPFDQEIIYDAWKDFGVVLEQQMALQIDSKSQLQVDSSLSKHKQSWQSLSYMNLMRSLTRLLFLGYGQSTKGPLNPNGHLAESSLADWYSDFYKMGVDLKAFDERSGNSGNRSFLEANFFTFSGDGDNKLSYLETLHFVSSLFTAGLSSSSGLINDMKKEMVPSSGVDPFGNPNFDKVKFKVQLKKKFAEYFQNLPGMVQYVKSLDETKWDQFYTFLDEASKQDFVANNIVETSNIRTMVTILHYIENMIIIFDRDGTQALSLEEVYSASPRFTPFFEKITGHTQKTILKEGFAYLVFKGKIPGLFDLGKFQLEKHRLPEAQRMEILRLFGTLKDQLNTKKK